MKVIEDEGQVSERAGKKVHEIKCFIVTVLPPPRRCMLWEDVLEANGWDRTGSLQNSVTSTSSPGARVVPIAQGAREMQSALGAWGWRRPPWPSWCWSREQRKCSLQCRRLE